MEVRTSLRKALGVAISAATLLALMPLGASMANAADPRADATHMTLDSGTSATLTVNSPSSDTDYLAGHTFAALRIGTYDMASKSSDNKLDGLAVGTVDGVKSEVAAAYTAKVGALPAEYTSNPVGAIAEKLLGYDGHDTYTTSDDTTSATSPYTGKLRDIANVLGGATGTLNAQFTSSPYTVTAGANATSVEFSNLPQGLYMIKDMSPTGSISATSQLSAPMMVGTAVFEKDNATPYDVFKGGNGTKLGVLNVKDSKLQITKTADDDSLSVGTWGQFHVDATVPVTAGFEHYRYIITDSPTKGFTLPIKGDANLTEDDEANFDNYKVKVYVKEKASDPNTSANLLDNGTNDNKYYVPTLTQSSPTAGGKIVLNFSDKLMSYPDKFVPGYTIEVTYSLKKNTNENNPSNQASLEHSKLDTCKADGTGCTTATIDTDKIITHSYGFKLKNILRGSNAALTGAKFTLTRKASPASGKSPARPAQTMEFFANGDGSYTTQSVDGKTASETVEVTNSDGTLSLDGLSAGDYEIDQTGAATGPQQLRGVMLPHFDVNLSPDPADSSKATVKVSVNPDVWKLVDPTAATGIVTVTNVKSVINLPLTGGAGIILAVIVALVLLLLFGGTEVLKRRHNKTSTRSRV